MVRDTLKDYRDKETNKLIEFVWPGGYPMYDLDGDNCILCPGCANEADQDPEEFKNFKPVAGDVYWEGPDMQCKHCNKIIESAYGNPDEKEEEEEIYSIDETHQVVRCDDGLYYPQYLHPSGNWSMYPGEDTFVHRPTLGEAMYWTTLQQDEKKGER